MTDDVQDSDLGRLRTYIHQGKIRKIEHLLHEQPKRLRYFLEQEFDACAYATKFKQDNLLRTLHDHGSSCHFSIHQWPSHSVSTGFPLDGYRHTRSITALIIAIRRCDLSCVQTLVQLGCDVNCAVRSYTIIPLLEAYQAYQNKREDLFLFEVC